MVTFLIIIIIVILLFLYVRSLQNQSDELDKSYTNILPRDSVVIPNNYLESLSYWESWKQDNPSKASALITLTGKNFSDSSDADVRQIVESFKRFADANGISDWNSIKTLTVSKYKEMVKNIGEEHAREVMDHVVEEDVKISGFRVENTLSYYAREWFLSYLKEERKPEIIESINLSPEEKIKKDFQEKVKIKVGNNYRIPLFSSGYDSPLAHEIISLMYSYLRNPDFKKNAEKEGLGNKCVRLIADEAESLLDKYCDASLQQCVDYYNFPNRPVVTSDRCPSCNSKHFIDGYEEGFECMECGRIWHAPYGRKLYL